jgi:cell division septation protein DedD
MMISMIAMTAAMAMQSDTTRASREAFTACLRTYVNGAINGGKTQEEFDREYPQQCTSQQQAFRDAVMARETALRATRANAESQADLEIEDARVNFSERFEPPRAAQQAAAQPAAQPAAAQAAAAQTETPAATPASQPQ